jgi:uncharacterized protein
MQRFAPGRAVTLRELWEGRVFEARPAIVVADDAAGAMFYVPSVVTSLQPVGEDGHPLRFPAAAWRLEPNEWHHHRVLSFAFPDTPYAVLATWDAKTDAFDGWYVNLQDPLRRTDIGFDTRDHVLDVLIPTDRASWSWKDEDEMAEAVALGLFTQADTERIRWAGERAVEHVLLREPPFDEDWEDWRPDPAWDIPTLPASADVALPPPEGGRSADE